MFFVLSPAKNLNEKDPSPVSEFTQPDLLAESEILMRQLRELAPQQIAELMRVSDKIALLNAQRNAEWHTPFTPENAKQAVFMFNGDVYEGMDANTLNTNQIQYLQPCPPAVRLVRSYASTGFDAALPPGNGNVLRQFARQEFV